MCKQIKGKNNGVVEATAAMTIAATTQVGKYIWDAESCVTRSWLWAINEMRVYVFFKYKLY